MSRGDPVVVTYRATDMDPINGRVPIEKLTFKWWSSNNLCTSIRCVSSNFHWLDFFIHASRSHAPWYLFTELQIQVPLLFMWSHQYGSLKCRYHFFKWGVLTDWSFHLVPSVKGSQMVPTVWGSKILNLLVFIMRSDQVHGTIDTMFTLLTK